MKYDVVLLSRAIGEFDEIVEWLARRSSTGLATWLAAFEKAVATLELAPLSCALAPENQEFVDELRQILFRTPRGRNYRLVFTVVDQQVRVLGVRGPGQQSLGPE